MITELRGKICEMYFGFGMQIPAIGKELNLSINTVSYALSKYLYSKPENPITISIISKASFTEQQVIEIESHRLECIRIDKIKRHKARRHIYYANQKKYRLAKKRLANI